MAEVVSKICAVVDVPTDDCDGAYEECLIQFNGETGLAKYDILPNRPDKAFTPIIIPKDPSQRVGELNTNCIVPEFLDSTRATPITSFGTQAVVEAGRLQYGITR